MVMPSGVGSKCVLGTYFRLLTSLFVILEPSFQASPRNETQDGSSVIGGGTGGDGAALRCLEYDDALWCGFKEGFGDPFEGVE